MIVNKLLNLFILALLISCGKAGIELSVLDHTPRGDNQAAQDQPLFVGVQNSIEINYSDADGDLARACSITDHSSDLIVNGNCSCDSDGKCSVDVTPVSTSTTSGTLTFQVVTGDKTSKPITMEVSFESKPSTTTQQTDADIELTWDSNHEDISVKIEKSFNGGPYETVATVASSSMSYIDTCAACVDADGNLTYRITYSNDPSNPVTKVIPLTEHQSKSLHYGYSFNNADYSKGIFETIGGVTTKISDNSDDNLITNSIMDTYLYQGSSTSYATSGYRVIGVNDGFVVKWTDFQTQIVDRLTDLKKIKKATIAYYFYHSDATVMLHEINQTPWTETDSFVSIGLSSIDELKGQAFGSYDYVNGTDYHTYNIQFDVTSALKRWVQNPGSANGFVMTTTSNAGPKAKDFNQAPILHIEYYNE